MDVILTVLEGAKHGAKIAVKKAEFFIGRSQECHLCAGSSAVSRRHCVLRRRENQLTIEDLGSRNGTLVNGEKTSGEVTLQSGDEIVIGPLKFRATISTGLKNTKAPEVKTIAEAADRAISHASATVGEDEISRWLLGPGAGNAPFGETQSIRMDDTSAVQLHAPVPAPEAEGDAAEASSTGDTTDEPPPADEKAPAQQKGKLPLRSEPAAKDSREAAAQALRNWSRRR